MSNCTRCQGLLVWDWDEALGAENVRCICCARRPLDPPPHDPIPHGLCKPKVGDLVTCRCGRPKVEWRMYCRTCSTRKLNAEQRRRAAVKAVVKSKKIKKGI